MAHAFKCDRCGKLYEFDIERKMIKGPDGFAGITHLIFRNSALNSNSMDLCGDCAKDFVVWWEHSNVSAAHELDRICSEMNTHEDHEQDI